MFLKQGAEAGVLLGQLPLLLGGGRPQHLSKGHYLEPAISDLLDRGEISLADAPELAVNLGFQLSELSDSPRTAGLVHKALEYLPA